jgi:predicted DNA repair protein MutK
MKKIFAMLFPTFTMPLLGIGGSKRTVNGAMLGFTKVLDELRAVKAQEDAEAERQAKIAVDAEAARVAAEAEALRAARAIAKVEDFVL